MKGKAWEIQPRRTSPSRLRFTRNSLETGTYYRNHLFLVLMFRWHVWPQDTDSTYIHCDSLVPDFAKLADARWPGSCSTWRDEKLDIYSSCSEITEPAVMVLLCHSIDGVELVRLCHHLNFQASVLLFALSFVQTRTAPAQQTAPKHVQVHCGPDVHAH